MDSLFDNYRKELDALGLSSAADLEKLVAPLIRIASRMEIEEPSNVPENSILTSHFGGDPYFETGEEWPRTRSGKRMEFIFQVFQHGGLELPENIELVQFYYDREKFPWVSNDDGYLVKVYEKLKLHQIKMIEKPIEFRQQNYCAINFREVKSLPDWEGIESYSANASKLSCILDEDKPWQYYQKAFKKLGADTDFQSQLGGYPKWVQGESTPCNSSGKMMKLLFQIDSEENAGLMWGDMGMVYVFYDEESKRIEFMMQCH
jgi:uncharacterized protein YwqG